MKATEMIRKAFTDKRTAALLAAALLALSAAGCGKKAEEESAETAYDKVYQNAEVYAQETGTEVDIPQGLGLSGAAKEAKDAADQEAEEAALAAADPAVRAAAKAEAMGLPAPPDIDVTDWQYVLANATHPLPEGYGPPETTHVGSSDATIDSRIADKILAFTGDCEDAGNPVYISSGYRSYSTQKELFDRKVEQYGEEDAAKIVLPPGTSEHQTGLCADITDEYRAVKNPEELSQTATFKWMEEHCAEYGFILRYPADKQEITDIIYEPWHFRYVGEEAARYITENGLCLEEFLELYGE